jgi:LmbE family N-acetylglucosaminyl deacetylase
MSAERHPTVSRPQRLLVIVAHPDDAESGLGGSVVLWVREGTLAHLVCCTSGDAGSDDANTDPLLLATRREEEQRAAARTVGYEAVTFLHRPDGALANDLALREQLVRIIRTFRPDAVAAPDPRVIIDEEGFIQHADHRAAGEAAVDAVYPAANNAMTFPHLVTAESLAPHAVANVLLFWSERPSAFVDIAEVLDVKVTALHAHASQHPHRDRLGEEVRARAARAGRPVGLEAAESFSVIELA